LLVITPCLLGLGLCGFPSMLLAAVRCIEGCCRMLLNILKGRYKKRGPGYDTPAPL
jgi:hypothetical protein